MLLSNWVSSTNTTDQIGPDGGKTLIDEELPNVGRVVVEKKHQQRDPKEYFAVTIFVYNKLLHTAYLSNWDDVLEHLTSIKILLQSAFSD